ncbi:hypothetical protein [Actinophytocola sp.]|uniref:hypothetical protein n=1 Tax=Actinophytocola sp. TaxID=1872138 RepID=UPI002D7E91BF|nr:hypothetical protein [Actinophytocola sp.]HET9140451.1 hypothetical protein [Actinophytocola sp.]
MAHDQKVDDDNRLRTEDLATAGETRQADTDELPPPRTADDDMDYARDGETRDSNTDEFDRDRFDTEPDMTGTDQDMADRTETGWTESERTHTESDMTDPDMTHTDTDRDMTDRHMTDTDMTDTDRTDTGWTEIKPEAGGEPEVAASERPTPQATDDSDQVRQLFSSEDVERFRTEWQQVQTMFVDDPSEAVRSADHLVAEVIQSLATMFNQHKQELEGHWREGDGDLQTEDLRIALRRYRSFFNQLLDA